MDEEKIHKFIRSRSMQTFLAIENHS